MSAPELQDWIGVQRRVAEAVVELEKVLKWMELQHENPTMIRIHVGYALHSLRNALTVLNLAIMLEERGPPTSD